MVNKTKIDGSNNTKYYSDQTINISNLNKNDISGQLAKERYRETQKEIKENKTRIGFWKTGALYGEFSNWYVCEFEYNGTNYVSSEQALMFCKAQLFNDEETMDKILSTTNNKEIKELGRNVKNFVDSEWSKIKYECMVDILLCKFSQNPKLLKLLLDTGDCMICEASPVDNIWGIGSDNVNFIKGENLLGKALMETREILKNNPSKVIRYFW